MTKSKLNILCLSSVPWDNPFRGNRQQVMRALGARHNVLYIQLPVKQSFRDCILRKSLPRLRKLPVTSGEKGILLLTPDYNLLPFLRWPPVKKIRDRILAGQISKTLRSLGWEEYLVWTYYFGSAGLVRNLSPDFCIYDCVDNHAGYALCVGNRQGAGRVESEEAELLREADLTVVVSSANLAAKSAVSPRVALVPSGVEFSHFHRATEPALEVPEELRKIRKPVAGFIGSIRDFRFDAGLVAEVAEELPELSLVLVGDYQCERSAAIERLAAFPNIHLLGQRPYAELPRYLKYFDLGITPYPRNPHTDYIYPLKYLEYLAAGKPVITTAIGGVKGEEFSGLLTIAADREEFIESVKYWLENDSPEERQKRTAFARERTWEKRADTILGLIQRTPAKQAAALNEKAE